MEGCLTSPSHVKTPRYLTSNSRYEWNILLKWREKSSKLPNPTFSQSSEVRFCFSIFSFAKLELHINFILLFVTTACRQKVNCVYEGCTESSYRKISTCNLKRRDAKGGGLYHEIFVRCHFLTYFLFLLILAYQCSSCGPCCEKLTSYSVYEFIRQWINSDYLFVKLQNML